MTDAGFPRSTSEPLSLRLRLAFETSTLLRAAAVAAELKLMTGAAAAIYPLEPLPGAGRSTALRTWGVELTTPPVPLRANAIHGWERKMLSLQYRSPDCRFLGWTTEQIPEMSARCAPAGSTQEPIDGGQSHTQRELVVESLRRRPSVRQAGIVHGRCLPR